MITYTPTHYSPLPRATAENYLYTNKYITPRSGRFFLFFFVHYIYTQYTPFFAENPGPSFINPGPSFSEPWAQVWGLGPGHSHPWLWGNLFCYCTRTCVAAAQEFVLILRGNLCRGRLELGMVSWVSVAISVFSGFTRGLSSPRMWFSHSEIFEKMKVQPWFPPWSINIQDSFSTHSTLNMTCVTFRNEVMSAVT